MLGIGVLICVHVICGGRGCWALDVVVCLFYVCSFGRSWGCELGCLFVCAFMVQCECWVVDVWDGWMCVV